MGMLNAVCIWHYNSLAFSTFFFQFHDLSYVVQVTETRTGPLGCSNYDNLDSVSSVLVQSPENKVNLQGSNLFCIPFVLCSEWHAEST